MAPLEAITLPDKTHSGWSTDFVSGSLSDNHTFRSLTIVDDFTSKALDRWEWERCIRTSKKYASMHAEEISSVWMDVIPFKSIPTEPNIILHAGDPGMVSGPY